MSENEKKTKRPRLDLPFKKRRFDPVIWVYDHSTAILATVLSYVLFGIAFARASSAFASPIPIETIPLRPAPKLS